MRAAALTEMLEALAVQAAAKGIALTVDAEESERLENEPRRRRVGRGAASLKGWDGFGMAVQAYGKRARRPVVAWANGLDRVMNVRLVKGAYWDSGRSSGRRSRGWRTIRCSPARRRPTCRIWRWRRTCWRRRISARLRQSTMR